MKWSTWLPRYKMTRSPKIAGDVALPAYDFVSGILIFRMFQNSWVASLIQSVIATLVLYVIFFKLLKLYNPPGRWLDLPLPF